MPNLFVYGTLKRGYHNWDYYLHGVPGVRFVSRAQTVNPFHMRDCGFPILLRDGDPSLPVYGELFEIWPERLGPIDRLEGNGTMYQREIEPVRILDGTHGEAIDAWVYIGVPEHWHGYQHLRLASINDHAAWEWPPC